MAEVSAGAESQSGGIFPLSLMVFGCGGPGILENPHFASEETKVSQGHDTRLV